VRTRAFVRNRACPNEDCDFRLSFRQIFESLPGQSLLCVLILGVSSGRDCAKSAA